MAARKPSDGTARRGTYVPPAQDHLAIPPTPRFKFSPARRPKPQYDARVPFAQQPAEVQKAMARAGAAWARLRASQRAFEKVMNKHYEEPMSGWDRLWGDLGA